MASRPVLLLCRAVGNRPRRVLNLSFLLNQNGPSSAGSLPLTDRLYNVTSLLHLFFRALGRSPALAEKCTNFFSAISRTCVLIRIKKYKKLQKSALLWVSLSFAYHNSLLPDLTFLACFSPLFAPPLTLERAGGLTDFLPVLTWGIHAKRVNPGRGNLY